MPLKNYSDEDKEICLSEITKLRKKINSLLEEENFSPKQALALYCGLVSEFFVIYEIDEADIRTTCDNIYKFTLEGRKLYMKELEDHIKKVKDGCER